jgi:dTDP-4-amino-4,6-dideoxygalactose transaminase
VADNIPLVDLKAQFRSIEADVNAAIAAVLARGDFILGKDVEAFEKEFAVFSGAAHSVGCANGTDALQLAMMALDIGPGDEVIVPAMTFIATALGVTLAGATPVLVDVEAETGLLDVKKAEAAITPRTKAILPVHLFGQMADLTALKALCEKHKLHLVEDAAQAHGANRDGLKAGTVGAIGCFSFYPGKNLGAYGDAGGLLTNDSALAHKLTLLRHLGSSKKYHHDIIGPNSRLDTIQAAILRVKLPHLAGWNDARRKHAGRYDAALADIKGVRLTKSDPGSVYHLYVIRVEERDRVLKALNEAGIGAGIHYPFALHELDAYASLGHKAGAFPMAEDWAHHCISLPIYAELTDDAAERAAAVLRQVI